MEENKNNLKNKSNFKGQKFKNNNNFSRNRKSFKKNQRNQIKPKEEEEIEKVKSQYENINSKEIKVFSDFPLSWKTLKGLKHSNYKTPTDIQRESIGYALQGKDILGSAITGSGKTLAFLVPILENLFIKKWYRTDGVGAIIISPTRELAYQIFETLRKIGAFHDFSAGLIIGGKNLKFERRRMDQCNIIICTPGRLLQHMDENPLFNCSSMQTLVLDEADRCLDMGFEQTMNGIIENLPPERQTLLFSATQTKSVKDLARLSLVNPIYIAPHEQQATTMPSTLQQNYVVIELEEKITMIWSFIKNHLKQKSIIFLSSCKQVKYIYEMFCKLRPGTSLLALYGTLHQDRRVAIYEEFCRKSNVVLFATDIASRGLDFPTVNWVIQLDCPEDATQYIHRAGRTARHKAKGESLLVLTPTEEDGMIEELESKKITVNKIMVDSRKMFSPRAKMEAFLAANRELKETAQRAYLSYLKSVYLMKNKKIFNIEKLNFDAFASSFGLVVTPRVRFLERLRKRNNIKVNKSEENNQQSDSSDSHVDNNGESDNEKVLVKKSNTEPIDFNAFHDSSEDEDTFLKVKRKNHTIESEKSSSSEDENETPLETIPARSKKVLTKASIAKRVIKKKIIANKKVQYNEDGEEILDPVKQLQSDIGKEYIQEENAGGIDIKKAKMVLKEEDKFDKQRFREINKNKRLLKKQKLRKQKDEGEMDDFGSDEDDEKPDLSWLPEPDNIYGPKDSDAESEDRPNNFIFEKPQNKRHLEALEGLGSISSDDEDVRTKHVNKKVKKIANKLSIDEAETLAMQLLGQ